MAKTYNSINTTTLSTTQNQVDFNGIPQTYTDLVLVVQGGVTSTQDIWLRFNGLSTSYYSRLRVYGSSGGTISTGVSTNQTEMILSTGTVGSYFNIVANIFDYKNTTAFKTVLSRFNSTNYVATAAGLWFKTPEAITSLSVKAGSSDTFTSGTMFSLYGIKAA